MKSSYHFLMGLITGQVTRRKATYNVNMDGRATATLLEMANRNQLQVSLYSSHVIEAQFGGGSVNRKQFPELIDAIMNSKAPSKEVIGIIIFWIFDIRRLEFLPFLLKNEKIPKWP